MTKTYILQPKVEPSPIQISFAKKVVIRRTPPHNYSQYLPIAIGLADSMLFFEFQISMSCGTSRMKFRDKLDL